MAHSNVDHWKFSARSTLSFSLIPFWWGFLEQERDMEKAVGQVPLYATLFSYGATSGIKRHERHAASKTSKRYKLSSNIVLQFLHRGFIRGG